MKYHHTYMKQLRDRKVRKVNLTVRVPAEWVEVIDTACDMSGSSRNNFMARAIVDAVCKVEAPKK